MSETSSLSVDAWSGAGPASFAAAAADRIRSTKLRLTELQQRMERLRAGEVSTRDDVTRARTAAAAQHRAYALAERRRVLADLRSGRHHPDGPTPARRVDHRYARLREAFVALASARLAGVEAPSDPGRRRELTTALVERASSSGTGWTQVLCQLCVAVMPAATGAAVSTYDLLGVAHPFAAADDRSLEIEELQQVVGDGPGHAAQLGERPILVDDPTYEDNRWPWYLTAIRGHGIGMVWSLPVMVDETAVGSLTLYHDADRAPERLRWSDAVTLAGLAAATMIIDADLEEDHHADERTPADGVALASGMLAVRVGTGVDQALALLRGYAFSTGRRLSDIAADVLAGTLDLG